MARKLYSISGRPQDYIRDRMENEGMTATEVIEFLIDNQKSYEDNVFDIKVSIEGLLRSEGLDPHIATQIQYILLSIYKNRSKVERVKDILKGYQMED